MGYFYIDDSVHDNAGFVLGACIYSEVDLSIEIDKVIIENGFEPGNYEFKSSANFTRQPQNAKVREAFKGMLLNCKLGVVILPREKRELLGMECIKAIKHFIEKNLAPQETIDLYFDQGLLTSQERTQKMVDSLGFVNCQFYIQQNSKILKGIQLADLAAHTASIYFKDILGIGRKMVKAGPNSGYDPDDEMSLGFEMWATLRYVFFNQGERDYKEDPIDNATLLVEPYGLFVSEYCDEELSAKAREAFAEVYLGCIH